MPNIYKDTIITKASEIESDSEKEASTLMSTTTGPTINQPQVVVLYQDPFANALKSDDLQQVKAILIKTQPSNSQLSKLACEAATLGCFKICDWLLKNCSHELVEADINICDTLRRIIKSNPSNNPYKLACLNTLGLWHGELHAHISVVDTQVKPTSQFITQTPHGIFLTTNDTKDSKSLTPTLKTKNTP